MQRRGVRVNPEVNASRSTPSGSSLERLGLSVQPRKPERDLLVFRGGLWRQRGHVTPQSEAQRRRQRQPAPRATRCLAAASLLQMKACTGPPSINAP